jgi:hypothetical protein
MSNIFDLLKNEKEKNKLHEELKMKEIIIDNDINTKTYFNKIYNNFMENNECKTAYQLLLFIDLNKYVHEGKIYCNPSIKTLMKECKCSKHAIRNALKGLEKIGYIVVHNEYYHGGKTASTIYIAKFDNVTGLIIKDSLKTFKAISR